MIAVPIRRLKPTATHRPPLRGGWTELRCKSVWPQIHSSGLWWKYLEERAMPIPMPNQRPCPARFLVRLAYILFLAAIPASLAAQGIAKFDLAEGPLELSGPASPWRFIHAVGEKSGLWGFENGKLEGWVYPLKIMHDFQLDFMLEGYPRVFHGSDIARSVRVFPHMVQLQYSAEQFTVTETLFAPRAEPGLVILLDVKAPAALSVYVRFQPDLNLMWPGGIGGQSSLWDEKKKWVTISEPTNRFTALIGSPGAAGSTAVGYHAYLSSEQPDEVIELRVNPEQARRFFLPIVIAGGIQGIYDAAATYQRLLDITPQLYAQSLHHYADLDVQGTQFLTPDPQVNSALRWSRVSLDQLKVCNPYVGCGYVSGYGSSGTGTRPMYAWFFDEPTVTSPAYLEYGGAESLKEALRFLQKYQRADGKIPHEVSQSAGLIDWFKDYPYAYIHPDSTLEYLIAMRDYDLFTGDQDFMKESWASVQKAYGFGVSILDPADGLPMIPKGEWGSTELADFSKDSAMAGEWIAALHAMHEISGSLGEHALASECAERQRQAEQSLEREFWDPQTHYYDYGLATTGQRLTYIYPAIGSSAALGILPDEHARAVLERLNTAALLSDWGQREVSMDDPEYAEGSYHVGSVWPVLTAGPLLGQYRYHNAAQGFSTWMAMMRLRGFSARGAMPEVFTGRFFRLLDDAVPHQMFSELTAIPGLIDGVLGLTLDMPQRTLGLAPHLPPDWPGVAVRQLPFGQEKLNLELHQAPGVLTTVLEFSGSQPNKLNFAPGLPAGSTVLDVRQDGNSIPFQVENFESDVHAVVAVTVSGRSTLEVHYSPGVAVKVEWQPLLEGDTSRNLRLLHSAYHDGRLQMTVEGLPGRPYRVQLFTPWAVNPRQGARTLESKGDVKTLELVAPPGAEKAIDNSGYTRWTVEVQLQK